MYSKITPENMHVDNTSFDLGTCIFSIHFYYNKICILFYFVH